ncbi:hypothetical protein G7Y89_g12714 [Cudoniella acicularis]|uniref:Uncharacterized protein n=1 Tax=Cudoniella acicularis TaxID=354080 RepID=A0A8H4VZE2_9HELO|nr:hypothetical protein G7Y89_g12714 [Cudoniella acicularis]
MPSKVVLYEQTPEYHGQQTARTNDNPSGPARQNQQQSRPNGVSARQSQQQKARRVLPEETEEYHNTPPPPNKKWSKRDGEITLSDIDEQGQYQDRRIRPCTNTVDLRDSIPIHRWESLPARPPIGTGRPPKAPPRPLSATAVEFLPAALRNGDVRPPTAQVANGGTIEGLGKPVELGG